MKIRLVEAQYKSISARNFDHANLALLILDDPAPIQRLFGEDASGQRAWDQPITGTPQ